MAAYFDINRPIVQISDPRGRTMTGTFYKHKILGKLNKCFEKHRPKTGLRGVLQHTPLVLLLFGNEK